MHLNATLVTAEQLLSALGHPYSSKNLEGEFGLCAGVAADHTAGVH